MAPTRPRSALAAAKSGARGPRGAPSEPSEEEEEEEDYYVTQYQVAYRSHARPQTAPSTRIVEVGLTEDKAAKGSCGTRVLNDVQDYWLDARKKRGTLGLAGKPHYKFLGTSNSRESFVNHTEVLRRRLADGATRRPTMMELISQRERAAVLARVAYRPASSTPDAAYSTEYLAHYTAPRSFGVTTRVVEEGLTEDKAAKGSCGTRALTNVNDYWMDARKKRGVLGLAPEHHKFMGRTNSRESFKDTSQHIRRTLSCPRPLTMNEQIQKRDTEAAWARVEKQRARARKRGVGRVAPQTSEDSEELGGTIGEKLTLAQK